MRWPCWLLLIAAVLVGVLLLARPAAGYADRAGTDIVMDAPWRCVRDEIPVLFFLPQFEGGRRVTALRLYECERGVPVGPAVYVDAANGPDTLGGATIVGPDGTVRGALAAEEKVTSFWHYVVRLPHAALTRHGSPCVHDLLAEVEWTRPGLAGRTTLRNTRVLRVVVDPARFPSFATGDRYFDVHTHTIAEQTTSGVLAVDGAHKAFGGPVVMLVECAHALGLLETRPAGEWRACADSLVVTDHNIFYSREPYDSGAPPRFGPTATTDGAAGEGAWYRENLGRLAGEEITLRRGSKQDGSLRPNIGHHLLAYGTRHFEGPWHGGLFATSRTENPNTLLAVLGGMKAAGHGGFVYAAHPELESFEWPPEYYAQGAGFAPYDSRTGPAVDADGCDFQFKGLQVWNIKMDAAARASGRLAASSAFDHMNPFEGGPAAQRFRPVAWDAELNRSLDTLCTYIGRGLGYAFAEAPAERFVRKLYLSGGSDAHGDFNYADEVTATLLPYSGWLHSNAWARVRTYALAGEWAAGDRDAVAAFADGNTVATDGPLATFAVDGDGRHDPAAGAARWHDAAARFENAEGRIGGAGAFDGGGTVLAPLPGEDAWIRSRWLCSVTPRAEAIATLRFDRVMEASRDSFRLAAGPEGVAVEQPAPVALDRLCALLATARDPAVDERCITNPVWVAPVAIEVVVQPGAPGEALLPPGALRVTFRFPFSMSGAGGARAKLRPLGADGTSTDPEVELSPAPGWEGEGGVASARYTVTNAAPIAAPPGGWDAAAHVPATGVASFVVWLERPADLHGNVLNDVARAFAVRR